MVCKSQMDSFETPREAGWVPPTRDNPLGLQRDWRANVEGGVPLPEGSPEEAPGLPQDGRGWVGGITAAPEPNESALEPFYRAWRDADRAHHAVVGRNHDAEAKWRREAFAPTDVLGQGEPYVPMPVMQKAPGKPEAWAFTYDAWDRLRLALTGDEAFLGPMRWMEPEPTLFGLPIRFVERQGDQLEAKAREVVGEQGWAILVEGVLARWKREAVERSGYQTHEALAMGYGARLGAGMRSR